MISAKTPLPGWMVTGLTTFLGWTLVGLMGAARTYTSLQSRNICPEWRGFFWPHMLSVWLWVVFTPIVFWLSSRWRFDSLNWRRSATLHVAAGVTLAALDVFVDGIFQPILLSAERIPFRLAFAYEFFINMFSYAGLVAIAHAVSYYKLFRLQETRSLRLETKLAQARIQALRSHLHPHFLFNTINAAAELVHEDSEAADRMLTRLGQLLQRVFTESQVVEVPLDRELSFARQYLDIAAIRFGDRLEAVITASREARRGLVPSFLLQPLVENAIHHGVERASTQVRVQITAEVTENKLRLTVSDTGPGLAAEREGIEWGTGLEKVNGLLRELHGSEFELDMRNRPVGGAIAEVVLPYCPAEGSGSFNTEPAIGMPSTAVRHG